MSDHSLPRSLSVLVEAYGSWAHIAVIERNPDTRGGILRRVMWKGTILLEAPRAERTVEEVLEELLKALRTS